MIQLHRLEGFYRVAKAGAYSRAAKSFPYPITQPGVHAQVRRLEQDLGVRLFEQVRKDQLVPTRAGQSLLDFCAPFFEQLPERLERVREGATSGRIRIEAGALEIQEVLPPWLMRVRRAHPEIAIELREIDSPSPERLLDGSVDLVVDYQPNLPRGIASRVIAVHNTFLVSARGALRRERRAPAFNELKREPFVALGSGPQRALQLSALRTLGAEPPRITFVPTVTSVLAFVAAGLGYSLIPWPTLEGPRVPGVVAARVRDRAARFPVSASFRRSKQPDPPLDAFLALAPRL